MKRCKLVCRRPFTDPAGKYTEDELFSDNDIATEILSRLPIKSLMSFKCTSKRWYSFLSDPSFLRIHSQRSNDVTVLVMQNMERTLDLNTVYDSIDFLTLTKTGYALNYKLLDFLPEKVIVLSSSHGILCCRSWLDQDLRDFRGKLIKTVTYICNPITRQWVQFKPNIDDCRIFSHNAFIPGFVFYPFCSSSSSGETYMFKLVRMFENYGSHAYVFDIYSSDTKKWKRSEALCTTESDLYPMRKNTPTRVIFANGWFHWWTDAYSFIAFHVEKELSKEIKVPCGLDDGFNGYASGYICWGESEGYFHYVYAIGPELQVWVLKNYEEEEEPAWELKYCLDMVHFSNQHSSLRLYRHQALKVLAFHEDVLYIKAWLKASESAGLVSYDFKSKTLIDHGIVVRESEKDPDSRVVFPFHHQQPCPILVPFDASLQPLDGVRRSKRNRKRKLLDIM